MSSFPEPRRSSVQAVDRLARDIEQSGRAALTEQNARDAERFRALQRTERGAAWGAVLGARGTLAEMADAILAVVKAGERATPPLDDATIAHAAAALMDDGPTFLTINNGDRVWCRGCKHWKYADGDTDTCPDGIVCPVEQETAPPLTIADSVEALDALAAEFRQLDDEIAASDSAQAADAERWRAFQNAVDDYTAITGPGETLRSAFLVYSAEELNGIADNLRGIRR
jgi:hypothetical protein